MAGIGDVAKKAGCDPKLAKKLFEAVVETAAGGDVVSIQGLGNFRVVDRKATKARNPQTGAQFDVGPSKRMKFTASKTLREQLNSKAPAAKPAAKEKPTKAEKAAEAKTA